MLSTEKQYHSKQVYFTFFILFALILTVSGCDNNPVKPDDDPWARQRDYYPLEFGSEWVYSTNENQEFTYTVITSKELEHGDSAQIRIDGGIAPEHFQAYWDYSQLFVKGIDPVTITSICLQLPLQQGCHWTVYDTSGIYSEAEVVAVDSLVTVPAGRFQAVIIRHINFSVDSNQNINQDTSWNAYALDVGNIFYIEAGGYWSKLKSFTIGVDDGG